MKDKVFKPYNQEWNGVKKYLLQYFYNVIKVEKDVYDRFFWVFVMFLVGSLIAQGYSFWSENNYFNKYVLEYNFPYPYQIALIANIFYELFKSVIVGAFLVELTGQSNKFNVFYFVLGIALTIGSVFMSINGITSYTQDKNPPPIDLNTGATDGYYDQAEWLFSAQTRDDVVNVHQKELERDSL